MASSSRVDRLLEYWVTGPGRDRPLSNLDRYADAGTGEQTGALKRHIEYLRSVANVPENETIHGAETRTSQ